MAPLVVGACACIVVVNFILYWRALGLYFIQDDFFYLWFTSDQSFRGFLKLFTVPHIFYRPISNFLYFFLFQGIFGTDPFPYHLANLLIHVFNSLATGYLVFLLTRNRTLAFVSALIFTSRVGHMISVYWICVTTQSMPLMFSLLAMILYLHYLEGRRPWMLGASYLSFALCAFSNINGPTLALLITLYDALYRRGRSVSSILRTESGYYTIVMVFWFLQFVVFGYHPPEDYHINIGLAALRNFGIFITFAYNSLYTANHFIDAPVAMLAVGILAGIATIAGAVIAYFRAAGNNDTRPNRRLYLFFGFWFIWGFAPYLPLSEHVWPQYITVSAVGLSYLAAALLVGFLRRRGLIVALSAIVVISFISIRLHEHEEYETKGIIYKSALAKNVISDIMRHLEENPGADKIIILDGRVELWWILHYGKYLEVFTGKNRPIFYLTKGGVKSPDSRTLVLRFENMHLIRAQ